MVVLWEMAWTSLEPAGESEREREREEGKKVLFFSGAAKAYCVMIPVSHNVC